MSVLACEIPVAIAESRVGIVVRREYGIIDFAYINVAVVRLPVCDLLGAGDRCSQRNVTYICDASIFGTAVCR